MTAAPSVFEQRAVEQEQHDIREQLWQAQFAEEATRQAPSAAALPLGGLDLGRLEQPLPPPRWLVHGRMTRQTLTVLGAKPGVGKSWLASDLGLAVASGRPFLGHPVPEPGRVLYVDAENGEHLALRRLRQLGGRPEDVGDRLRYSTEPLILTRTLDVARFRATLEQHRPDLVIVDTLASHAPGAEVDTEGMAGFLAAVWIASRSAGAAMLLLHHLRKGLQGAGKDDPLDSLRGAGHLSGAADRVWILDPLAPGQPRFILRDVKPREFPCADAVRISVVDEEDSPEGDRRTRLEVQGVEPVVERGYDSFLSAVLTFVDAHHGRAVRTADLLHLGLAMPDEPSKRSCNQWLARAAAAGVLHKPKQGFWERSQAPQDQLDDDEEEAE